MISIIVFVFGLFNFLLLWLTVHTKQQNRDWRDSFISASLYFGVFMWGLAEFLSLFSLLSFSGILLGWICYDIVLLSFLIYRYKHKKLSVPKLPHILHQNWISYFICFILVLTFFIAIIYPPNNCDSMTYHLPRIEHWIQNENLNHYYTSNPRQLMYAPFPELSILHGRILSGNDWLMNLTQWFSFLGSIIVITKIASLLGLSRKQQLISGVFFATLPMAILQASSTQTDLVVAFWLLCLVERLLIWNKDRTFHLSMDFGIALGLAILSKGTAYPIAFPFVVIFAVLCIKQYKKYLFGAFCAALICLMINMPHYTRNYISYKNPIETNSSTVADFSLKSGVVNLFSNIYVNTPIPLPEKDKINDRLRNMDKSIFPYGSITVPSVEKWFYEVGGITPFHEDAVKNPFHTLFLLASFIFIFIKGRDKKNYMLIIFASWIMFIFCIPWQPWITRLQVPLFALSAPVFALMWQKVRYEKLKYICLYIICGLALLPLFFNMSRPLLYSSSIPFVKHWTSKNRTVWNTNRDELIFNNNQYLYMSYKEACETLRKNNFSNIGLCIGGDTWEYPIWRYLKDMETVPCVTHQKIDSIERHIEALFILKGKDPFVLSRNKINPEKWDTLYYIVGTTEKTYFSDK